MLQTNPLDPAANQPTGTQLQTNPQDMLDPFRSPHLPSLLALPAEEQQQQAGHVPQAGPGGAHVIDSDQ